MSLLMFFDGPFFACLSPDGSIKSEHADVVVDVEAVVVLVEPDLGHGEGLLEHGNLRKFILCPASSALLYSVVNRGSKRAAICQCIHINVFCLFYIFHMIRRYQIRLRWQKHKVYLYILSRDP